MARHRRRPPGHELASLLAEALNWEADARLPVVDWGAYYERGRNAVWSAAGYLNLPPRRDVMDGPHRLSA